MFSQKYILSYSYNSTKARVLGAKPLQRYKTPRRGGTWTRVEGEGRDGW